MKEEFNRQALEEKLKAMGLTFDTGTPEIYRIAGSGGKEGLEALLEMFDAYWTWESIALGKDHEFEIELMKLEERIRPVVQS